MPVAEQWAYFDHAAMCALPRPAAEAFQAWLTEAVDDWQPGLAGVGERQIEAMRQTAAQMIGVGSGRNRAGARTRRRASAWWPRASIGGRATTW